MEKIMLKYLRTILSTLLISTTAFLVGCSGCVSKAGDKVIGSGTGTVGANGTVTGSGSGTSYSQVHGNKSGSQNNSSVKITMSNPTDKIVCTSSTGVVTVYSPGQTINSSGTSTCVDTPASQVPSTSTDSSSGGSGTTTTGTGTGSSTTTAAGSGSAATTNSPALSF
jgi:hypothetical protein